jgi:hypothetical protein
LDPRLVVMVLLLMVLLLLLVHRNTIPYTLLRFK